MATNSVNDEWMQAMKAKGHTPRMNDYDDGKTLNIFVTDAGYHNGPGCETCGWSCCKHCDSVDEIRECTNPALELTAVEIKGALPAPAAD